MKNFLIPLVLFTLFACEQSKSENTSEKIATPEAKPILPERVLNVAFLVVDGVYNSELVAPMDILHHTVFHTDKGMKVFLVAPE